MTRLPGRFPRLSSAGGDLLLNASAVLLAAWQSWGSREVLDPDGVAYLDLGAAWIEGDSSARWNPYWSPLYAWIVAWAEKLFEPGPEGLAPLLHVVGFGIFLAALASFRFLLRRVEPDGGSCAWRCAAYALFLEATLGRISLARTTPDLLLATLLFLAAGLALERRAVRLGAVLGAAYLAKAAALPLAPVFVLSASRRGGFILRSAAAFGLVSGWWIAGLSLTEGKLTFGDAGKLNYAWNVLGVERPYYPPTARLIFDQPAAYEFAEPFAVTYPPHYGPSHWYRGLALWWDAGLQFERLRGSFGKTVGLLLGPHLFLLTGLIGLRPSSRPALLALALAGLALYQPVFVAERYVAPFVALFWLAWLPEDAEKSRLFQVAAVLFLAAVLARVRPEEPAGPSPGVVAQALRDAGVRPGDPVAAVWPDSPYLWARPAKARIVAESRDPQGCFWRIETPRREALLDAFARAGAVWAVAPSPASPSAAPGWRRVRETPYVLLRLDPQ
ncbi:MAG: hypothetical protein GC160_26525 [Acidobacteria bacterium]|nr:hypothetical protein [Acidobacteriota bacterium]